MKSRNRERGAAMVEAAIVTPILLLLMVGIFEIGRAFETWQVLTNAAREGARLAVTPTGSVKKSTDIIRQYMADGQLSRSADAPVVVQRDATITVDGTPVGASLVTIDYPFEFIILQPVARLVVANTTTGEDITMRATALMRNEAE